MLSINQTAPITSVSVNVYVLANYSEQFSKWWKQFIKLLQIISYQWI